MTRKIGITNQKGGVSKTTNTINVAGALAARGVDDPPSRSTIYRVLHQLREDNWIEQRGNGWHPDVKAQMLSGKEKRERGFSLDMDDIL